MKILFIAPIPPPVDGQSKASKVLLDRLIEEKHDVCVVNLSKRISKNGYRSTGRIYDILKVLFTIWKRRKDNDIIYLSLAESFLGNIRDIFIYIICYKSRNKMFVHMLGGAGMKMILTRKTLQQKTNCFFIRKLAGVIVEGPVNAEFFSKVISDSKIHIVPNFAEDFLFVDRFEIIEKFANNNKIQLLYLSNLLPGKGYNELADAYIALDEKIKELINVSFVGGFESRDSRQLFLEKIKNQDGLEYLGKFIDGEDKRALFCKSHIFCLPTYYPFEGQPISILEAYATGCVVITSNHSGIPYIFSEGKNGFLVEKKSITSIMKVIENMLNDKSQLENIALNNRVEAFQKYRTQIYQDKILKIFNN